MYLRRPCTCGVLHTCACQPINVIPALSRTPLPRPSLSTADPCPTPVRPSTPPTRRPSLTHLLYHPTPLPAHYVIQLRPLLTSSLSFAVRPKRCHRIPTERTAAATQASDRTKRLANSVGQMLATDGDGDYDGDDQAVDLLASGTSADWSSGLPSPALSASASALAASTAHANGGNQPTTAAPRTMSVSPMFALGAGAPPSAENGEEEDGEVRSKSPPAIRAQPSPGRAHAARSSTNERLTNILQVRRTMCIVCWSLCIWCVSV